MVKDSKFSEFKTQLGRRFKVNSIQADYFTGFYIFNIVVDKQRISGYNGVTIKKNLVKFWPGFSHFFHARDDNTFKPVKKFKGVERPWKSLGRPVCQCVKSILVGFFNGFQ